jgi:predicted metal-binding protein
MNITLCASCALGKGSFAAALGSALATAQVPARIATTDCMSGCLRESTAAFRAPGKTAYLFGDLSADDLPGLVTFARAYAASPDGNLPDTRILGPLRLKAIARIPA